MWPSSMQHVLMVANFFSKGVLGWLKSSAGRSARNCTDTEKPDTRKRKIVQVVGEDPDGSSTPLRKRRMLDNTQRFAGMSEREKLEAQGFDESWTQYSVLLLERPGTGLFLTPQGKRRPIGKSQGRPAKSRIAVIKSPKLSELDWFKSVGTGQTPADTHAINIDDGGKTNTPTAEGPDFAPTPDRLTNPPLINDQEPPRQTMKGTPNNEEDAQVFKRKHSNAGDILSSGFEATASPRVAYSQGKPPKRRKTTQTLSEEVGDANREQCASGTGVGNQIGSVDTSPVSNTSRGSVQLTGSEGAIHPNAQLPSYDKSEEIQGSTVKEKHTDAGNLDIVTSIPKDRVSTSKNSTDIEASTTGETGIRVSSPATEGYTIDGVVTSNDPVSSSTRRVSNEPVHKPTNTQARITLPQNDLLESDSASRTASPGINVKPLGDVKGRVKFKKQDTRGGSVAFLRKKIVMDIIEANRGAFPMGSELWYPFTTAWFKANHKERPDQRTIRSAVKSLIESGKLCQHTFSGKNTKGVIVTKSIIARPDISANDVFLTDMQRRMLEADPQFYIPSTVEVDPSLRKSHHAKPVPIKYVPELRPDLTVAAQQKPARVRLQELRAVNSLKRRNPFLFGDSGSVEKRPRVERLKTTKRRSANRSFVYALTSEPQSDEGLLEQFERGNLDISPDYASSLDLPEKSKYALTMSPPIGFHIPSGTFGTGMREVSRSGRGPRKSLPAQELPQTLNAILSASSRPRINRSNITDDFSARFFSEVDAVRMWESSNPGVFDLERNEWKYFNHTTTGSFKPVPLEGSIRFESDEPPRARVRETKQTPLPSTRTIIPPSLNRSSFRPEPIPTSKPRGSDHSGTRRLTQLQALPSKATVERLGLVKRRRPVQPLPENTTRKIIVAIVVIRTLAGGWEGKLVDWSIVASIFPEFDINHVKRRGKLLLSQNRLQMIKMQSDFQERFAEAYEKDQVPRIDYNNLESYDWNWVVEWTQNQLEMPRLDKLPSLPATREQFESLFEIRKEPIQTIDEIYQHNAMVTIPRKQALFAGVQFSVPLSPTTIIPRQITHVNEKLDIAKTWVRANVVTPEESYKPAEARNMLQHLGDGLVGQAIQSLITERVISMGNRGRVTPGRNYDVTDFFLNALHRKRPIESAQLKRAASYKTTTLDTQLHLEGTCDVKYDADDGDILALINLLAEERIIIWPRNPPRDKYGLTDGGYLTRLMDKGRLRFDMEVHSIPERYVYGNPLEERLSAIPIPRGDLPFDFPSPSDLENSPPLCKIPLWFDIHGQFVPLLWDLVVCASVGVIATRSRISTASILRVFQPYLGDWEIQLVLDWLEKVGAIRTVGYQGSITSGWEVMEWWWMIV